MASYTDYDIPLIRSDTGSMPIQETSQGGKFLFVITGDLAGATIDLEVEFAAHPTPLILLSTVPDKWVYEVDLPMGTSVRASIMGGSPTTVDATLILVE